MFELQVPQQLSHVAALFSALLATAAGRAFAAAADCSPRFVAPDAPLHANGLNGVALPDACFYNSSFHVFLIGDWGGIQENPGQPPVPADHRSPKFVLHHRPYIAGVDNVAQLRVADQMRQRAAKNHPDYIINVGDNFYWGGVTAHCGAPPWKHIDTGQWQNVYEKIYTGIGLDNKQWLGVLGNHDYGGYRFTNGWDQAIGYTWAPPEIGSTRRWMTPAQYWSAKVLYTGFSVDYYFVDSNVWNALNVETASDQNLCGLGHNPDTESCGPQGPQSVYDCPGWFGKLWADGIQWLDERLDVSQADWQIAVTHFPPHWGSEQWAFLADMHGIDLILTGHTHKQEVHHMEENDPLGLNPTAWVTSGGGGGITSEGLPDANGNDDMYGFMDLTLSNSVITIEAISHGGILRSTTKVSQRLPRTVKTRMLQQVFTDNTLRESVDNSSAFSV